MIHDSDLQVRLNAARATGDRAEEARLLNRIGAHYHRSMAYDAALAHYEQSLAINRHINHTRGMAVTLNNCALILQSRGKLSAALSSFQESLLLRRQLADRPAEAAMLVNIGRCLIVMEDFVQAETAFCDALIIYDLLKDDQADSVRRQLARVRLRTGQVDD